MSGYKLLLLFALIGSVVSVDNLNIPRGQGQKLIRNRKLKATKKESTTTPAPTPRPTAAPVSQGGAGGGQDPDRSIVGDDDDSVEPGRTSSGIILENGSTYSYAGVLETSKCASFDSTNVQAKLAGTTGSCASNECGGCCRIRGTDLVCDTTSTYSSLQCVCNANTFDWSSSSPIASPVSPVATPVASPVVTPVAPVPVPVAPVPVPVAPVPVPVAPVPAPVAPVASPTAAPTVAPVAASPVTMPVSLTAAPSATDRIGGGEEGPTVVFPEYPDPDFCFAHSVEWTGDSPHGRK